MKAHGTPLRYRLVSIFPTQSSARKSYLPVPVIGWTFVRVHAFDASLY